jgi:hypothetical protein
MIPSFRPGILSSNRIRAAAVAADVTPNAVNWNDVEQITPPYAVNSNTVTFSGINTTITLHVNLIINDGTLYASKNGGGLFNPTVSDFTVNNGDTLYFQFQSSGGIVWFEVYNVTDNNTLLDTCTLSLV